MTTLYPQLLPDGSRLWYASAVPAAAGDNPAGFNVGDLLIIIGAGITNSLLGTTYKCTVSGSPGTWIAVGTAESGTGALTQFAAGNYTPGALNSTFGTLEAGVAQQVFVNAVFIPYSVTLTGIAVALNANSGTDKAIVALYSGAGVLIASSAAAGTTITPSSTAYQKIPFTATANAIGPALHFITVTTNGTTGQILTQISGTMPGGILSSVAFGAPPATIVPPSTFTTLQAPIGYVY